MNYCERIMNALIEAIRDIDRGFEQAPLQTTLTT